MATCQPQSKTRPCRKCGNLLIPGAFWSNHTLCKACDHAECKAGRLRRRIAPVRPTVCKKCPTSIEPVSESHIPQRRICKSCKHENEAKRYVTLNTLSAKWASSEAFAMRSVEQSLALYQNESGTALLQEHHNGPLNRAKCMPKWPTGK